VTLGDPLTVAGAATDSASAETPPCSLLIPCGNRRRDVYQRPCGTATGAAEARRQSCQNGLRISASTSQRLRPQSARKDSGRLAKQRRCRLRSCQVSSRSTRDVTGVLRTSESRAASEGSSSVDTGPLSFHRNMLSDWKDQFPRTPRGDLRQFQIRRTSPVNIISSIRFLKIAYCLLIQNLGINNESVFGKTKILAGCDIAGDQARQRLQRECLGPDRCIGISSRNGPQMWPWRRP